MTLGADKALDMVEATHGTAARPLAHNASPTLHAAAKIVAKNTFLVFKFFLTNKFLFKWV